MSSQFSQSRFAFTDRDFNRIRQLVATHAGINLTDKKRELVYGRLASRLRKLSISTFADYCKLLDDDASGELVHCINAITTNVTSFFREPHHFEFLQKWLQARDQEHLADRRLRIWSAGCSSGQEPYTIALALLHSGVDLTRWNIEILASDIDSNILATAQQGVYRAEAIAAIDPVYKRWFQKGMNEHAGMVRVKKDVKRFVQFRSINLLGDWPELGRFDIIFCRNVIIYFTVASRHALLLRFADQLKSGGHLILGHSESIHGATDRFRVIGRTINRKLK